MIPSGDHCPRFASLAQAVNPPAGIKSDFSPLLHYVLFYGYKFSILGKMKGSF